MRIKRMQIKRTNKSKYIFLCGLVIALIASVLVVQSIRNYSQVVEVVHASRDIEPFTRISDGDLELISLPGNALRQGMALKKSDVVGKFARGLIVAGTPINSSALTDIQEGKSILSAKITQLGNSQLGAFAVPLDSISALHGQIVPGDRVHVIGALNVPVGTSSTARQPVSKIIAPYARVIQMIGSGGSTSAVILALTPQQAQDIQLALLNGRISLMLLPYEPDYNAGYTQTTTVESFVKKYIQDSLVQN